MYSVTAFSSRHKECSTSDHYHVREHSIIAGLFGNRAAMKRQAFDHSVNYLGKIPMAARGVFTSRSWKLKGRSQRG